MDATMHDCGEIIARGSLQRLPSNSQSHTHKVITDDLKSGGLSGGDFRNETLGRSQSTKFCSESVR
jgi:hypothetical protein